MPAKNDTEKSIPKGKGYHRFTMHFYANSFFNCLNKIEPSRFLAMTQAAGTIHFARVLTIVWFFILVGCGDPWNDKNSSFGFSKGTVFELVSDAFLYRYLDEYSLMPEDSFDFTIREFNAAPAIGHVDQKDKIYVIKVIPAGTKIKFTSIRWQNDWNTGGDYLQYAIFSDSSIFSGEVSFGRMLCGPYGVTPTDEYLKKL